MARKDRTGPKKRQIIFTRPKLGHYLIFTDTEKTEKNYFAGLQNSLPPELRGKIVLRVFQARTANLVRDCLERASKELEYAEKWIVLDRDRVENFDKLVADAEASGIRVGWSNPCIETWFSAYFGQIVNAADSVSCCSRFGELFQRETGREYKKNQEDLYAVLTRYGDEAAAVRRAVERLNSRREEYRQPSQMVSCTTLHELVGEIRKKRVNVQQE